MRASMSAQEVGTTDGNAMTNYMSGPIIAVMGTAEGVIVKARELIDALFTRAEGTGEAEDRHDGPADQHDFGKGPHG